MRMALLMGASLLATACGGQQAEAERADQGTAIAQPDAGTDAGGAFAAEAPGAQDFAQAMAVSDMFELESSKIALKKVKSGPVRDFAQMMIADHTKSTADLKKAIADSGKSLDLPASLDVTRQTQIEVLNRLNGQEFETEYLNQQKAGHRQALDMLKSYAGGGDTAELRQFAQATIPAVQKHSDWLDTNAPGTSPMRETPEATGGRPGAAGSASPTP
jgi:putative membrane protein